MQNKLFLLLLLVAVLAFFSASPDAAAKIATPENSPAGEFSDPGLAQTAAPGSSWTIAKAVLPEFTIRRTAPEVRIQFTVADARDRLLQSLSKEDFRIFDNRLSVPRIASFSRQEDLPLQIGVLLDVSDSVEKTRARERLVAGYFFANVPRPEADRVTLLAFSNTVRVWQSSTGNRDELAAALARIQQQGFATYLFDSVYRACLDQFSASRDGDTAQRVLLVISDGIDTGSLHSLSDAISAALRREVQIFAVSVHSPRVEAKGDTVLQGLAEATGGRLYVANSEKDFPAIFTAMAEQMRTQYSVSFQPSEHTPGFHAVKIQVPGSEQLHIHARAGYFFEASQ